MLPLDHSISKTPYECAAQCPQLPPAPLPPCPALWGRSPLLAPSSSASCKAVQHAPVDRPNRCVWQRLVGHRYNHGPSLTRMGTLRTHGRIGIVAERDFEGEQPTLVGLHDRTGGCALLQRIAPYYDPQSPLCVRVRACVCVHAYVRVRACVCALRVQGHRRFRSAHRCSSARFARPQRRFSRLAATLSKTMLRRHWRA
jgi:hypothetical protein